MKDPIIEELHKIREEHAVSFNYDINAILADLNKRQQESGAKVVSFPPKPLLPKRELASRQASAMES